MTTISERGPTPWQPLSHARRYFHDDDGACLPFDHKCVDGLSCSVDLTGNLKCTNSNLDDNGSKVAAFHDPSRCASPDLDHGWFGTHREANFFHPNRTLTGFLSNGFVCANDLTEQVDNGVENATEDQTIGFYNQNDIPFYYDLAQKFAISDRYFASVLGPTFPNRSYLLAATSFGHLTTNDTFPPPGGYKPITGTIFDLLNKNGVTWADNFQHAPQGGTFLPFSATAIDPHFLPLPVFPAQAGVPGVCALPQVAFVDPNFGLFGRQRENDEHPPTDIQRGQSFVSGIVNLVRNSACWKDSIVFITYDEHGGYYDHAKSPRAPQGIASTPDGIAPGNAPTSLIPRPASSLAAPSARAIFSI